MQEQRPPARTMMYADDLGPHDEKVFEAPPKVGNATPAAVYTTDAARKDKVLRQAEGKQRDGRYTRTMMPKKVKRAKGKAQRAARRRNRR